MTAKEYIDSLFSEYEENIAINDFKEELLSNMQAHIDSLKAKGLSDSDAFHKAAVELGDISALANQISLNKKQEVYETMYMKTTRSYISLSRRIAYITALGIFLFGVLVTLMSPGNDGIIVMIPFGIPPIAWATYLLFTQETPRLNPMKKGRACIYSIAVALFSFGLILFLSIYHRAEYMYWGSQQSAFSVLIPFGIPSILALVYLILTEQSRTKPWVTGKSRE